MLWPWSFKIGVSLEFGCWSLGFFSAALHQYKKKTNVPLGQVRDEVGYLHVAPWRPRRVVLKVRS
jgi:hypothetical protein